MGPNLGWWVHVQTRWIRPHNYSNRMLPGCQMSYINLQGFGDVEASEGTKGHNNYSLGPILRYLQ